MTWLTNSRLNWSNHWVESGESFRNILLKLIGRNFCTELELFRSLDYRTKVKYPIIKALAPLGLDFNTLRALTSIDEDLFNKSSFLQIMETLTLRSVPLCNDMDRPEMDLLCSFFDNFIDSKLKYCPVCIKDGRHLTVFQFKSTQACSRHRVSIEDKCPTCGQAIPIELINKYALIYQDAFNGSESLDKYIDLCLYCRNPLSNTKPRPVICQSPKASWNKLLDDMALNSNCWCIGHDQKTRFFSTTEPMQNVTPNELAPNNLSDMYWRTYYAVLRHARRGLSKLPTYYERRLWKGEWGPEDELDGLSYYYFRCIVERRTFLELLSARYSNEYSIEPAWFLPDNFSIRYCFFLEKLYSEEKLALSTYVWGVQRVLGQGFRDLYRRCEINVKTNWQSGHLMSNNLCDQLGTPFQAIAPVKGSNLFGYLYFPSEYIH